MTNSQVHVGMTVYHCFNWYLGTGKVTEKTTRSTCAGIRGCRPATAWVVEWANGTTRIVPAKWLRKTPSVRLKKKNAERLEAGKPPLIRE